MPKEVTTICEYGIAFLGPYCAIEARLLEWDDEWGWIKKREHTTKDDESRRDKTYWLDAPKVAISVKFGETEINCQM